MTVMNMHGLQCTLPPGDTLSCFVSGLSSAEGSRDFAAWRGFGARGEDGACRRNSTGGRHPQGPGRTEPAEGTRQEGAILRGPGGRSLQKELDRRAPSSGAREDGACRERELDGRAPSSGAREDGACRRNSTGGRHPQGPGRTEPAEGARQKGAILRGPGGRSLQKELDRRASSSGAREDGACRRNSTEGRHPQGPGGRSLQKELDGRAPSSGAREDGACRRSSTEGRHPQGPGRTEPAEGTRQKGVILRGPGCAMSEGGVRVRRRGRDIEGHSTRALPGDEARGAPAALA
ncbi:uncharacterized protein [Penaeus vannamei]|uniref:uncharacterized protein n=1 Tax=Penaeus vannamei TaxID=6689 RepID=UPI00387F4DE0